VFAVMAAVIQATARLQGDLVRKASPGIANRVSQGEVKVVAAFGDLASAAVSSL
jgi:hypothetical protein